MDRAPALLVSPEIAFPVQKASRISLAVGLIHYFIMLAVTTVVVFIIMCLLLRHLLSVSDLLHLSLTASALNIIHGARQVSIATYTMTQVPTVETPVAHVHHVSMIFCRLFPEKKTVH